MADAGQLLATLHPFREPPPPAPVLPYVAMLAAGIAVAACAVALLRLRRRRALRLIAICMLAASRLLTPPERLAAQAQLLRRLVRATGGEAQARAQGPAWLAALDGAFATTFFTQGQGRLFADGLYRRGAPADLDEIDRALAGLIAGRGFGGAGLGAARPAP